MGREQRNDEDSRQDSGEGWRHRITRQGKPNWSTWKTTNKHRKFKPRRYHWKTNIKVQHMKQNKHTNIHTHIDQILSLIYLMSDCFHINWYIHQHTVYILQAFPSPVMNRNLPSIVSPCDSQGRPASDFGRNWSRAWYTQHHLTSKHWLRGSTGVVASGHLSESVGCGGGWTGCNPRRQAEHVAMVSLSGGCCLTRPAIVSLCLRVIACPLPES